MCSEKQDSGNLANHSLKSSQPVSLPDAKKRACEAARIIAENRGGDIKVLDLRKVTQAFDFFVIASGTSRRQLHAVSDEIDSYFEKELGDRRRGIEGYQESRWIVLDYGDVVVHLFEPEKREFYALDDLWGKGESVSWEQKQTAQDQTNQDQTSNDQVSNDQVSNDQVSDDQVLVNDVSQASQHPSLSTPALTPLELLKERFAEALTGLIESPEDVAEMVRPAQDVRFGDFQANMAMPLAKRLHKNPREVAAAIVSRLRWDDILHEPEIAGPGFINLTFRSDVLAAMAAGAELDERLRVPLKENPRTIVIDYSAPNAAKPMHVGHIRSTCIGRALYNILGFLGNRVISDNHLGDWGTQFGMIIYGYRNFLDEEAYRVSPVQELTRLYRLVRQKADADENVMKAVLLETSKLHHGDEENRRLWKSILPSCLDEINKVYDRLGITFDHTIGESFYNDRLAPMVEKLKSDGIAQETDGAVGIFLDGEEVPMLVQKSDGAYLYATTDLAAIRYRINEFHPDAILYVVDFRQAHHFEQLFKAAKLLGMNVDLVHVKFGTVLGDDGKPFKTRSGDTVGLEPLLDEAQRRALAIVTEGRNSDFSEEEKEKIARTVGIGALVYADLSQNRESDYTFSFDKMLAMNGNTAAYMQYAYARIRTIFSKGGIDPVWLRDKLSNGTVQLQLEHPAERALALALLKFADALEMAARDYRPNHLTAYLFDLAGHYSTFFENCPVLKAESTQRRDSRLVLCDLTARTIQRGLALLGIGTVERM